MLKNQTIATRLGLRLGLTFTTMFASFGALIFAAFLVGEQKWVMAALIPVGFFFPFGALIFLHMTMVCPYCQTFDPVGWMSRDTSDWTIISRKTCPTCHARMDKPFDPERPQHFPIR